MERPWTYYLLLVVAWLATLWGLWQIGDAWVTWPTIDAAQARDVAHDKLWLAGGLIVAGLALGGLATLIGLVQDGFARLASRSLAAAAAAPPAARGEARPVSEPQAKVKPEIRPEARPEPKREPRRDPAAEPESAPKREPRLEPAARLDGATATSPREPRLEPSRPAGDAPARREPKLLRDS
jgi:hypothetical protein